MDSPLNTYLTLLKMSENDPRYESMLFNYETTMKNDFRNGTIENIKRTTYKEKPKCLRVRPPPLKDIHTLTEWKTPYLPIDLLVKPKEVVRTDPRKIQERYTEIIDLDKDQVRATRPRLVMTPAISIDDIVDERQRELLIKETYTTSTKTFMESGVGTQQKLKVVAPLQAVLSPANPITIQKYQFPYVSPEWRMDSVSWDSRQRRGHCDPDKDFYLARTPQCKICEETAERQVKKKPLGAIKDNNIQ